MKTIEGPCIQVCKLKENICIGGGRTRDEITLWSSYSDKKRKMVMEKLNGQHQYVVEATD